MVWGQYKKTFWVTQLFTLVITAGVFHTTPSVWAAAVFFIAMQLGAIFGAIWATRLRRKAEGRTFLP
jgi:hypothetical protein